MADAPSPYKIQAAMSAAMKLRSELVDEDGAIAADDQLLTDMIEGQTDVFEVLDRVIETSIADGLLADLATARASRLKARRDRLRDTALAMIEALEIHKPIERAAYTASITRRTKAIVTDAGLLPAELLRQSPDMLAIGRALKAGDVPGATLSNPTPSLSVRTR